MTIEHLSFIDELIENPIIAAVRNESDLAAAIKSSNKIVFVLYGTAVSIHDTARRLKEADKSFFIHLDMIEGLKNDEAGLRFIKETADPHGIITTKHTLIKYAKNLSLCTILRWFIIDSKSLSQGMKNVDDTKPDAVEVMPGVSQKIIKRCVSGLNISVIAGGLIETKDEVFGSLKAGAIAISTTHRDLWELN